MATNSNKEYKIDFNRDAFIKITDTNLEYHRGVVNDYILIIPLIDIREISIKKRNHSISDNPGCNFILALFNFISKGGFSAEADGTFYGEKELNNAELTIRYKSENKKRWVSKDISWPGLTEEKANKIIRILKMKNQNL